MPGGGEPGHVQADLGDDQLSGFGAQAGNLAESVQRVERGWMLLAGPGIWRWRAGVVDLADEFGDALGELGDLRVEAVDLVEQDPGQFAVVCRTVR
jgi:hypothetical protein